jgi:hypothetical protein
MSGHYGELVFGQKRKIDILFSPLIRNLPSPLLGHVVDTLSCPRVMAAPENIKAGFLKQTDEFAAQGIKYIAPLVCLGEQRLMPRSSIRPSLRPSPVSRQPKPRKRLQPVSRRWRISTGWRARRAATFSGAAPSKTRPAS